MPTKIIHNAETGEVYEEEMNQEEANAFEAARAASEAQLQQEQAKRDAWKAKAAEVKQFEEVALAIQISDAELSALPPVLQKMYRILRWLREKRALETTERGNLPFDLNQE